MQDPNGSETRATVRSGPLPPVWFLLALVGQAALQHWLPLATVLPAPWHLAGLLPLVAGLGIAAVAARAFARAGTAIRPFRPMSALVETGLYRVTRNPMYLGMLLVLAGSAMLTGSLSPFLVLPVFFVIIRQRFVLREEALLEAQFGAQYRAFRERVPRWL